MLQPAVLDGSADRLEVTPAVGRDAVPVKLSQCLQCEVQLLPLPLGAGAARTGLQDLLFGLAELEEVLVGSGLLAHFLELGVVPMGDDGLPSLGGALLEDADLGLREELSLSLAVDQSVGDRLDALGPGLAVVGKIRDLEHEYS